MFEKILQSKEDKVAFLNEVIKKATSNEGVDIPELKKEFEEIQPFFTDDKEFVTKVNENYRRLKKAFTGEELEKALNFVRARKVRNHLIKRAEEALGYRCIAKGEFSDYQIVAKRIEVAIRKDTLIEKVNYKSTIFTLTSETGFKEVENPYYQRILEKGKELLGTLANKGVYSDDDIEFDLKWKDEDDDTFILVLPIRLTCEKRETRRQPRKQ